MTGCNKTITGFVMMVLAVAVSSCTNKIEQPTYEVKAPTAVVVEDATFEIQILNPNLSTVQEIKYVGKKMGDFYKIENHNIKKEGDVSKTLFSKSYLVEASKFKLVYELIKNRVNHNQEPILFSDSTPVITSISLNTEGYLKTKQLDLEAAAAFEKELFRLLDGDTATPKAVEIPTH